MGLKEIFAEKGAKGSSLVWLENYLLGKIKKNYMSKEEGNLKMMQLVSGGGGITVEAPEGAYQYKGQVETFDDLPTDDMSNDTVGYTYDAKDTGMNWAWNGLTWDNLGPLYSFEGLTDEELEILFANTDENGFGVPDVPASIKWLYSGAPKFTVNSDTTTGTTRTLDVTLGGPAVLHVTDALSNANANFGFMSQAMDTTLTTNTYIAPFIIDTGVDGDTNFRLEFVTVSADGDTLTRNPSYSVTIYPRQCMKGIPIPVAVVHATSSSQILGYTIFNKTRITLKRTDITIIVNVTLDRNEIGFYGMPI